MDWRRPVRLCDGEQVPLAVSGCKLGREARQQHWLGHRRRLVVRHDAEPGPRHDLNRSSLADVEQAVLAVAEKDEVVLSKPLQEGNRLVHLAVGIDAAGDPCEVRHSVDTPDHRMKVTNDPAYRLQRPGDGSLQRWEIRLEELAVQLVVLHRLPQRRVPGVSDRRHTPVRMPLATDDRVENEEDAESVRNDLICDRIEQEGAVRGVDLDDGSRSLVTVIFERRIEHPDSERLGAALDEFVQ